MYTINIVNLVFFALTIIWIMIGIFLETTKIRISKTIGNELYFITGGILVMVTFLLSFL